ncbi:hypothetical protein [Allocoleopsis franciscana]|nr:hypothetical protein [Allocoleopsis franciscana]
MDADSLPLYLLHIIGVLLALCNLDEHSQRLIHGYLIGKSLGNMKISF